MDRPFSVVDTPAAWREALSWLNRASRLAIDLEADGFHRYPERLALIQIGLPDGRAFVLDPLVYMDFSELGLILADAKVPKILHSASYDLRLFDYAFGFRLHGLVDTAVAAQFCGAPRTGLASVLADELGIQVEKPLRLQRLDWSIRPLPADALEYAVGDVTYLFQIADHLQAKLEALGRVDWVAEECARLEMIRYTAPDPPEIAFIDLPHARDLTDRGRAVLRELVIMREAEARRRDRPPFKVLSHAAMIHLAADPQCDLAKVPGLGRWISGTARRRLTDALRRGVASEPIPWPRRGGQNPWSSDSRDRLSGLKRWRQGEAERLGLEPGILWPMAHLEAMALSPDTEPRALDVDGAVRAWQWRELGPGLEAYRTIRRKPGG